MKKQHILILAFLLVAVWASAQTTPSPQQVVESMYILPKRGMEEKFEAAIKAHNQKFHPAGPHVAGLRKVEYGTKAGWYVWIYGPTTFDNLDSRPAKENGHQDDWTNNIDPLIEEYGSTGLWAFNADLTFGYDIFKKSKYAEVWAVDIKPGEYYRFKAMAGKLKKAIESLNTMSFLVLDNQVHVAGGPDVTMVWSFNTYKEWSEDSGLMEAYEKINGKGTWQTMLTEWRDIIVDYDAEIRSILF